METSVNNRFAGAGTFFTEELERRIFANIFGDLSYLFPELKLKHTGGGAWTTILHKDGTTIDGKKAQTSSIYPEKPHVLIDHARGGKRLIWVLIDIKRYPNYSAALTDLCQKAGIDMPEMTEERKAEIEEYKRAAGIVDTLHSDLIKADDGSDMTRVQLVNYLKGVRKWTDPNIFHSALGYITREKAKDIGWNDTRIGTTHRLALPIYYCGQPRAWMFRCNDPDAKESKYLKLKGCTYNFLAGLPSRVKDGMIIVVEGVMDYLHADAINQPTLPPVVATLGGSGLTDTMINDAMTRGVDTFILGFDNDDAGREFARKAAERIWKAGATALHLHYPDGCKDLDDALKSGSAFDIFKAVENAESYAAVRANEYTARLDSMSPTTYVRTAKDVANLIQRCDPIGKTLISYQLDHQTEKAGVLLKGMVDGQIRAEAIRKAKAETYRKIATLTEKGDEGRAMRYLQNLRYADTTDIYRPQNNDIFNKEAQSNDVITTPYYLSGRGHSGHIEKAAITLQRGAVTTIGARSGHGKTSFMISLACRLLKEGRTIVYCTGECSRRTIRDRFISIMASIEDKQPVGGNMKVYGEYYDRFNNYLRGRNLLIFRTRDIDRVCNIAKELRPDVLFVDYLQLLRTSDYHATKKDRLEAVCGAMEEAVSSIQSAIVAGIQLNRNDTPDPLAMSENSIADAIDIEQFSDSIYLFWNSVKRIKRDKNFKTRKDEIECTYKNLPFEEPGAILVKCVKARSSVMQPEFFNVFKFTANGAVKGVVFRESATGNNTNDTKGGSVRSVVF